jgi:hypothetical protein
VQLLTRQAQDSGIFTNLFGESKIVDVAKAAHSLGSGTFIQFTDKSSKSRYYSISNGRIVDPFCDQKKESCELRNPSDGTFRIANVD